MMMLFEIPAPIFKFNSKPLSSLLGFAVGESPSDLFNFETQLHCKQTEKVDNTLFVDGSVDHPRNVNAFAELGGVCCTGRLPPKHSVESAVVIFLP